MTTPEFTSPTDPEKEWYEGRLKETAILIMAISSEMWDRSYPLATGSEFNGFKNALTAAVARDVTIVLQKEMRNGLH